MPTPTGTNVKGNFFIPEVFVDAVEAAFAGLRALYGTRAVIINTSMPGGPDNVGELIKVPYFTAFGAFKKIAADGGEIDPAQFSSSAEQEIIWHGGAGIEWTRWCQANPTDPYGEGVRQLMVALGLFFDGELIAVAGRNTGGEWDVYTEDAYSTSAPKVLGYDQIVAGITKLGDEGHGEMPVALCVHSKVMKDLRLDKDGMGRPKLVTMPTGTMLPVVDGLGIPIIVSDRMTTVSTGKYKSMLVWPDALSLWLNGTPLILGEINARKPSDAQYVHVYGVTHRYKHRRGKIKPGVVHLIHN